jgi:hypothetical protein
MLLAEPCPATPDPGLKEGNLAPASGTKTESAMAEATISAKTFEDCRIGAVRSLGPLILFSRLREDWLQI